MKPIKTEIITKETDELMEAVAAELKKPDPTPEVAEGILNEKS